MLMALKFIREAIEMAEKAGVDDVNVRVKDLKALVKLVRTK